MNEALREQISAYVDGELSDNESELLLRRMCQDADLRGLVAGYMTMGRAVRGDAQSMRVEELRARIAEQLGEQSNTQLGVEPQPAVSRFVRPVAGVGIAAAVAVMALVLLQQVGPVGPAATTASTSDLAAIAIDEVPLYTEPSVEQVSGNRPSGMVTQYYQQHNERAADLGGNGIITRLVELELRDGELVPADAVAVDTVDESDDAASTDRNE
ncbi:MAG: sigma-E factor negative regulatory protein [Pseudomonadota bacterium]